VIDEVSEVELVNVPCVAIGTVEKPAIRPQPVAGERIVGETTAWFGGEQLSVPIYSRRALPVGMEILGPAIIEELGGTTVLPPGWRLAVEAAGNLIGSHWASAQPGAHRGLAAVPPRRSRVRLQPSRDN
jgi:N-methylhydantoinase A/oxoprolinase/acetone carboxylase beta subunit